MKKILIIGYGNPGRQDDGLGPVLVEEFVPLLSPFECIEIIPQVNYQLVVEDALQMSQVDTVIFVDASLDCSTPYFFKRVKASDDAAIGSHSVSPEAALNICETLYQQHPDTYVLGIRGYAFDEFEEALSKSARENMIQAFKFLKNWLEEQGAVHA